MGSPIVIAAARRTPIGKFGGSLSGFSAADLGGFAANGSISASGMDPTLVDLVIFGHARQAGQGPNPARQVVRKTGLEDRVPAFTINQACASGLRAIISAAQAIETGEADIVLAGGMESMSNTPYLLPRARWGYKAGHAEVTDGMYRDGFVCPLCGLIMGETAEKLATQEEITREAQDRYAVKSQRRWAAARDRGRWKKEIVPVSIETKKGTTRFEEDEHPRPDSTMEGMAKLEPVFAKDGTVHPGNASGVTDGAAACLVMTEEKAKAIGVKPMAKLRAAKTMGVDPSIMGIGPVSVVTKLLGRTKHRTAEIDLVELNEAFAAQVLACNKHLEFSEDRLNINGGAIALGHPIGATGARVVTTLLHDLEERNARLGIATLCVSGGMGVAALFERI